MKGEEDKPAVELEPAQPRLTNRSGRTDFKEAADAENWKPRWESASVSTMEKQVKLASLGITSDDMLRSFRKATCPRSTRKAGDLLSTPPSRKLWDRPKGAPGGQQVWMLVLVCFPKEACYETFCEVDSAEPHNKQNLNTQQLLAWASSRASKRSEPGAF